MNKKSKGDSQLTVQVTVSTTMAKRFTEGLVDQEAFCLVQPRLMFFSKVVDTRGSQRAGGFCYQHTTQNTGGSARHSAGNNKPNMIELKGRESRRVSWASVICSDFLSQVRANCRVQKRSFF